MAPEVGRVKDPAHHGDAARVPSGFGHLRFVLFEAGPGGLPLFPQLVRASELSPSQARAGLACLHDIITEREWPPLSWTGQESYQLRTERPALEPANTR